MKLISIILSLLAFNFSYSQSNKVTIIGNMPQLYGGGYVIFSKPIGKFTTSRFFINSKDSAAIHNDRFVMNMDISTSGIINIYEKPYTSSSTARFFAEPGDTIFIERQNGEIIFKGKNAIINKMFTDLKISPIGFGNDVYKIFKENNNFEKIIFKIKEKENEYFNYYNNLFLKNEISNACLNFTNSMMEQSIEINTLNIAKDEKYRVDEKFKVSKFDTNKIIDFINNKYIFYNEKNIKSLIFYSIIRENATYLEQKALVEKKNVSRFWNQYDNVFKSIVNNFGAIDYIDSVDYKEIYIGSYFLWLIKSFDKDKSINYKDLILVYNDFVDKYPNSSYVIPLSKSIMDIAYNNLKTNQENDSIIESNITLGNLAYYDTTLRSIDTVVFAKSNQELIDALIEKFPNQDLFIDFWATFCSPCIKQFSYNNDLHIFLESKNIKTFYLSEDKEEDKAKWEKNIQDYQLTGYHFLANNIYREKYINPLGEFIPMYYLYNSKTKKLKFVDGYPSEKEKFYAKITSILNN